MKRQKIEEVDIAQLKPHPRCANIYRKLDNVEFTEEIRNNGILHPPIVDTQNRIIGGERTIEAAMSIGYTKIKVCVVDVSEDDAPAYRVFSNTIRDKSATEVYQELIILRDFYGTRQGQRPVIHELQTELDLLPLRKKMAKITGLSETNIHRIHKLGKLNLLSYADKSDGLVTALHKAAEQKSNGIANYKPIVEIPLTAVCCNQCKQPTGRLVFTRAKEIQYKDQTGADQILF
jgi:hypothetical protein